MALLWAAGCIRSKTHLGPVSGIVPSLEAGQLLLSCEAFQYSVRTALYSDPQPHMGGEGSGHASSEKPMTHLCGSPLLHRVGSSFYWYLYNGFEVSSTVFKQTIIAAQKT